MLGFFKSQKSKDIAKKRLQLVSRCERIGLPINIIEKIKEDLIGVFSEYPYFDVANIKVNIKKGVSGQREELWISIPIKEI